MNSIKQKERKSFDELKTKFGYKNFFAAPQIVKVVVNTGIGSGMKKDRKINEFISGRLAKITGQKPSERAAKKSIAGFKIREGDPVGLMVTLRGKRMYNFLDKLFNVAIPRTKDFRGIKRSAVDEMGNFTIGIKEHTIFPETSDEELKDIFGLAVTIVTTAKSKEEAESFLRALGLPLQKNS